MKEVRLSKGAIAIVDDVDFEFASSHKYWINSWGYAYRSIWLGQHNKPQHKNVSLHRELMGVTDPRVLVDHINGDTLDNRRCNLRLSTKSTNGCNRPKTRANTTGYKGVVLHTQCKSPRWMATITVHGKHKYLGLFPTPEEAAKHYNEAALLHFGEYARLNKL